MAWTKKNSKPAEIRPINFRLPGKPEPSVPDFFRLELFVLLFYF